MNNIVVRLFIRFVCYLLLQVLVLNNVNLTGLMSPYFYPLFILVLPLRIPQWVALLLAAAMGYFVGIFTGSAGLHMGALLILTMLRPMLINLFFSNISEDDNTELTIKKFGAFNFILYVFLLLFIHHFFFFIVQIWSFQLLGFVLLKIILSSLVSNSLILLSEYLFWNKKG